MKRNLIVATLFLCTMPTLAQEMVMKVQKTDGTTAKTRVADLKQITFLGTDIDEEKNHVRGEEIEISVPGSKVRMFVIPTNEELVIARDTKEIVEAL